MSIHDLRSQVYQTAMRLVPDGLAHGAQGNISAFDRETGLVAVTPSAIPYERMEQGDIVITDLQGQMVEGHWKPTSEIMMHTIFYLVRPDVNAVVHTHAPYASIFAVTYEPIETVLNEAAASLTGTVPVAPYQTPGTLELARSAFKTMGDGVAVVLGNHGLLTVGETLPLAYDSTLAVEMTARIIYMARSMGSRIVPLDAEIQKSVRENFLKKYHPQRVEKQAGISR